ncbi:MAG TPA: tetratricopeptide repeat protein [Pyrinomonadaceae bacterium]|nr:tetratricopeptide repeat protein [Pyrinomonadaceae bacterium]
MKTQHTRPLLVARPLVIRSLVAALAVLLAAQAAAAKETWTSVRSQNFFLVGSASEKEIRQVATRLEQFREVFTKLFPKVNFNTPVPTTVVVFKSDSAYKPFKPVADGKTVEVGGYFQSGEDVNYITLTPERAGGAPNPYGTIYHEYTHLLVNNSLGPGAAPAWFNEGLAEYYSTFAVEDDRKVHLGRLIDHHIYLLREQKMIPLAQLFAVTHYSLERNRHDVRSLFYAQSWALMHYLIQGDGGKRVPQLGVFLDLSKKGVPTDEGFRRAFQTDTATMEKELHRYVRANTFMTTTTTFPRKLEFDAQMTSAPLTEAEAEAYLGDLLLHIRRPEEAAARLQRALDLDPKNVMARTSLGMARLRQKREAEAIVHLREAAAAAATNYLPHYSYAYALSRVGLGEGGYMPTGYPPDRAAEMRAALRKAISLRPDFPESYHLLAWVTLVNGGDPAEGVRLIRQALSLAPGNQHYALVLAQLYLRQEKFDEARRTAELLAREGTDPGLRATAQQVLGSINNYEGQLKRYRAAQEEYARGGEPRVVLREEVDAKQAEEGAGSGKSEDERVAEALAQAINDALRKPQAGETRLSAVLTSIECGPKGLVFVLKAGDRTLRLTAAGFGGLHLVNFNQQTDPQLTCGARKSETPSVVTFRAERDARAKTDGPLVALEFVPANFKLK